MGRPINKDKIGFGAGRIKVTRHFFTGGSEATSAAHIVRQAGNNKFVVRLDSNNGGGGLSIQELMQVMKYLHWLTKLMVL